MDLERLQVVISANIAPLQKSLKDINTRLANIDKETNKVGKTITTAFANPLKDIKEAIDGVKEYNKTLKEVADYTAKYDLFGDPKEQPWKYSVEWIKKTRDEYLNAVGDIHEKTKELTDDTYDIGTHFVDLGTALDKVGQLEALLSEVFANRSDDSIVQFNATLVDLAIKSAEVKTQLEELTLEYEDLAEAIELANKSSTGSISTEEFARMNELLGDMTVEQAQARMEELKGKTDELGLTYSRLRREIDAVIKTMGGLDATVEKTVQSTTLFSKVKDIFGGIKSGIAPYLTALKTFGSIIGTIAKKTYEATNALGKMLWQLEPIHKLIGRIGAAIKSLGQRISRVFVYSTIISFFRSLKSEIGSFLTTNTELMNALAQAKGAWITAFMPIYNTVIPMLISLINWLTVLGQKIALLTHRIFGGSIGASKAQAKALKEMGGAAGGAAAEFKPILAAFDELNRLEEPDAGGGGGAGDVDFGFEDIDESALKEYLTWYDWLFDKTQKIIALHKELDKWLQKCANTINWFFKNVLQMFRGDNDQMAEAMINQWKEMGKTLAEAINHFVDTVDWNTLGRALGAGLDLAFYYLTSFIRTMDWRKIGSAISDAINGAISEINWSNVGELLVAKFNIIWNLVAGFVSNLDFKQLGRAFSQLIMGALSSIDTASYGEAINKIVIGLLQAFNAYLTATDWGQFGMTLYTKIHDAAKQMDWLKISWEIIKAIVNGLIAALVAMAGMMVQAIVTWVEENIIAPFKKILGIASPSTVFEGFGINIVEGLVQGLQETWGQVTDFFNNVIENLKNYLSTSWDSIKNTATQKWNAIKDFTTTTATNIKTGVINAFSALAGAIGSPLNSIKGAFSSAWSGIVSDTASKFGELISNIGGYVSSVGASVNGMLSTIGAGISSAWGSISNFVASALAQLASVKIPAMASGGVITKPTVGLIGEYSGAKTNPEIVTPEKLLRNIVGESNNDVADTLISVGRQIVEAIQDNNIEVKIGDDVISAAAARGNKNYMKRTGRSQFA